MIHSAVQENSRTINEAFTGGVTCLCSHLECTEEENPQLGVVRGAGVRLRQGVTHIKLYHLI